MKLMNKLVNLYGFDVQLLIVSAIAVFQLYTYEPYHKWNKYGTNLSLL